MAQINISNSQRPVTFFGFKSKHFKDLVNYYCLTDVNFESDANFYNYVWMGFNPEVWELKNKNNVLIKGKPYKEYLINRKF